jgi:hypothetical protein
MHDASISQEQKIGHYSLTRLENTPIIYYIENYYH